MSNSFRPKQLYCCLSPAPRKITGSQGSPTELLVEVVIVTSPLCKLNALSVGAVVTVEVVRVTVVALEVTS